ncbi:fructose-1,6-bisphosphatase II [Thermotomaculum hydrothermale]|uniref:Fructose-1,6-bisphosphatase n=1 Tax=Thermotomaculum hydrothermale TaxID=981385 RepID=A0A7R6PG76_9BACT|nr:class II fructose-bisphosphatase [Thermotomaculum hydrothermale]BBB33168.1 fructose-1,6-bisphosphatase II [Thermotomaculum hydrothermale]
MPKNIEDALAGDFLRVAEMAAIAAARTVGKGDRKYSDKVAVEAMRKELDNVDINGEVVIGEGERDKAPMLYIGEKVGTGDGPAIDIAVDPLEGTNLCATGANNAIAVIAASERGGLLNAPDIYMEKIIVPPSAKGKVSLDNSVEENLKIIADSLDRKVEDLTVIVLDRPRHEELIARIREAGARINLIGDGDLSAGISVAVRGTGVHAVFGIGGAPEGVLTAAALRCLGGEIQGRLIVKDEATWERMQKMGIKDPNKIYTTEELASGENIIFVATGVTNGNLLKGVRFFGEGIRVNSLVMRLNQRRIRFVDTIYLNDDIGQGVMF